jgi:hypothetical protein
MPGEAEIARASAAADEILRDLAIAINDEIRRIIVTLDTKDGVLESTKFNLRSIAEVQRQVQAVIDQFGSPAIGDLLDRRLPEVIEANLRESGLEGFAPQITDDLLDFLDGLERDVIKSLNDTTGDLSRAIRRGIVGTQTTDVLLEAVARSLDTTLGRASVAIEGGIRRFNERTLLETGKGLEFLYVYIGPDDTKTRPYCRPRVGKVLTQEQAEAATANVDGRWNCRHDLAPITRAEAEAQGLEFFRG